MAAAPPRREAPPPTARAASGTGRRGSPITVEVPGLRYFLRQVESFAPHLIEEFKKLNFKIGDLVAQRAAAKGQSLGGVAAKAARTLRSARSKETASVTFNSKRVPFGAGAEYGSLRFPQFKEWRGNGEDAGYFLHPTIRQMTPELVREYEAAFDAIAHQAFPETRSS